MVSPQQKEHPNDVSIHQCPHRLAGEPCLCTQTLKSCHALQDVDCISCHVWLKCLLQLGLIHHCVSVGVGHQMPCVKFARAPATACTCTHVPNLNLNRNLNIKAWLPVNVNINGCQTFGLNRGRLAFNKPHPASVFKSLWAL